MKEYLDVINLISTVKQEYFVSGSVATMIYLNEKIRDCNDIDIHFNKPLTKEELNFLNNKLKIEKYDDDQIIFENKIKLDINYDIYPTYIYNNIRLVKLEKLIGDKINRCLTNTRNKDIYDLYFLLDLKYDSSILNKYIKRQVLIVYNIDEFNDSQKQYKYQISLKKALEKILNVVLYK